jgi:Raf kinase inhibitor-like YbhB/YbcL family protein
MFAPPATAAAHCTTIPPRVYVLRHPATDVVVYVNGRRRLHRHGRGLTRVRVPALEGAAARVRIVVRSRDGRRSTIRRVERASCGGTPAPAPRMRLASPAFADGAPLPSSATCRGAGTSPPLSITGVPAGARELVLLMTDPDTAHGTLSHWVVYDIAPSTAGFPAGGVPAGAQQGPNSFGQRSYLQPCPVLPAGKAHRYVFELFAEDTLLTFDRPPDDPTVRERQRGHVLGTAGLTGTYAINAP